jgi:hypothetical protein
VAARGARMATDCRAAGGYCDMGACAPGGGSGENSGGGSSNMSAGAAWTCACDAGWELYPAVGAAPRCTVQTAVVLALSALQAVSAALILLVAVNLVRGDTTKLNKLAPDAASAVFAFAGAALTLTDPTRLPVGGSSAVFVLKMTSGWVTVDVATRLTIVQYRRAQLSRLAKSGAGDTLFTAESDRAVAARTRAEIAASLCVFSVYVSAATSCPMSTRHSAAAFYLYWCYAPAFVWASALRTTSSLLRDLGVIKELLGDSISTPSGHDMARRISLAQTKARHVRLLIGSGLGSVMVLSLTALLFLSSSDQWCWLVGEIAQSISISFTALTLLALTRVSRLRKMMKRISLKGMRSVAPSTSPTLLGSRTATERYLGGGGLGP